MAFQATCHLNKGGDTVFKIGLRNIKTAIAVGICILVLGLIGVHQPFFACMTAVFTMQANVETSFEAGLSRFLGTLVGAVTGTTFAALCTLLPMEYLLVRVVVIPLGSVFVVHVLHLLKLRDSVFIACIVYFALMMKVEQMSVLAYATSRTALTGFGAIVALLVNRYVFPPQKVAEQSLPSATVGQRS